MPTITPMDPETFAALISYVAAGSALATAAILGLRGSFFAPMAVGKLISLVTRRNV